MNVRLNTLSIEEVIFANIPVCLAMGGQQGNWRSRRFVCYCKTSSGDAVTLRVGVYIPRGWIRRYGATYMNVVCKQYIVGASSPNYESSNESMKQ